MGLFSRMTDIIHANLNTMLDRAEDPAKIVNLMIQEMEDTLVEVRSAAVKTIAERKEMARMTARLEAAIADWSKKAELALTKDREDLARAALAAKQRAERDLAELSGQLAEIDEALEKQNQDIGRLQAKLDEAKAKRQAMTVRAETAENRLKMRRRTDDDRLSDAFARFEQVQRRIDIMEGRVEAHDLGRDGAARGEADTLEDAFADLEYETGVEEELARLRARMKAGGKDDDKQDDRAA